MTEEWIPKDKSELMSEIEKEWNLLINVVENLTDKQMTTPDEGGWSPKDNLAHLSEWINILIDHHIDHRPNHEALDLAPDVEQELDFNDINSALFEKNRNRSREDVLGELKQLYAQMMAKLESMTFEDFMKPRDADDPEKRPLVLWILGNTTEHFAEHRETIEKAMAT